MASGLLGSVDLSVGVLTAVYLVPVGKLCTLNLSICNRGNVQSKVRVALINGGVGAVLNSNYIEYDTIVLPTNVVERTGIVIQDGYTLAILSDVANVSVSAWGFEDTI